MVFKTKTKLTIPALLKKAQLTFNRFIRERDKDFGCISCGAEVTQAGHYYSAGHYSVLRFNEINTNGQCTRCNCFLHGNLIHYRQGLVKKYGEQKVLLLDSAARESKKWDRVSLEWIISNYSKTKTNDKYRKQTRTQGSNRLSCGETGITHAENNRSKIC